MASKYHYVKTPLLQVDLVETSTGSWIEIFNLKEPYNGFQSDSVKESLDYIEVQLIDNL